jgi:putative ABC transport system permease protein
MAWFGDVRHGLRSMAGNPGFTGIAVATLALGIGVNATVFAIADGMLFKSMPFVSDRIGYLSLSNPARGDDGSGVSYPDFRDWQAQAKSFAGMALFNFDQSNLSDKTGVPARFNVAQVTANTCSLIGQRPVMGRDFTEEDGKPGAAPVAILGDRIWTNRYGNNPSVIGMTLRINDVPTTVIGVMRPEFRFPYDADLWTAFVPGARSERREARDFNVIGELAPGITPRAAAAEMNTIARNLQRAYPDTNQGMAVTVHTFAEEFTGGDIRRLIFALLGSVLFVLLIACANVANMLLARAVERSREISIRIALGAGRWRIIRQLMVESVMLSTLGGMFGWLISKVGLRVFDANMRDRIPSWVSFSMDYRGFAYLAAISLGTGLLFGLAPALRLSRLDVNTSLKEGGRGSSGAGRGKYLSAVLVVAEMALAVVLLAGAGLMIRSFLNIYRTKTGVNEKNVLVMRLLLPEAKYSRPEDQVAFHERLKARLEALPGVDVACISITMPTGGSLTYPYEIEGRPPIDLKNGQSDSVLVISPDYFRAMDVRLIRGRAFTEADGASGTPVAIVNQRFAEKFFRGDEPIGRRLRIFEDDMPRLGVVGSKKTGAWMTVVGVAPNILQNDIDAHRFDPLIYVPYRQKPMRDMALMARTRVPPSTLINAFRRETQAVDQDMPLYNIRTLQERLAINYWQQGVFGTLFGIFAAIALVLASVGLYAVIAHSVSQRTQEIGVRMALGASAQDILSMVFAQGLRQLLTGLGVGLLAAWGVTRVLSSLLVQVSPTDPATFALISLTLGAAAMFGCLIPARRAMSVDPVVALRNE